MRLPVLLLLLFVTALTARCITPIENETPYGISPTRAGYVPARMAIINCIFWPDRAAKLKGMPLSNVPSTEMTDLCTSFDQFVTQGFENQPFMKGLSAKFVEKMYASSNPTTKLAEGIAMQWQFRSGDCATCAGVPSFYNSSIAPRKEWAVWLSEFSKATKSTDALLVPIVIYNMTTRDDNRGIVNARRSASIALLLIDPNTGDLIWSGGRESEVTSKIFADDPRSKTNYPPPQDELKKHLFTDAVWLGFPGRQIYK